MNPKLSLVALPIIALAAIAVIPAYRVKPWDLTGLDRDNRMMVSAFAEIGKITEGEGYPIGAVVAIGDEVIGRGANHVLGTGDPLLHAETVAIQNAIKTMRRRRPDANHSDLLQEATVYVTLEPCPMDAGTIVLLRIRRVVLCDLDHKWGAFGTVADQNSFPHRVEVARSGLPRCQDRSPGTADPGPPWQAGRAAAEATGQVPSLATALLHRLAAKLGPNR